MTSLKDCIPGDVNILCSIKANSFNLDVYNDK